MASGRRSGTLAALATLLAWLASPAAAVELETLVMPGPVIEGHADVESDCSSCHRPFDRAAEDALCVECHEEVGEDRSAGRGFHGLAPGVKNTACRSCHTDHEGRDADVVGLDPDRFDHELTDHPLRGAHRGLACASCHEPDVPHREAPADCVGCHGGEDDPHRGALGEDCASCHGEATWKRTEFDHGRTDFPLEGRHAEIACGLCHADQRWEGTPTDCASCHRVDDVHRGEFGPRCGDCHDSADWKRASFDHDRTDFPLRGGHRGVACASCHAGGLEEPLATDCVSCHGGDDVHRGRYGRDCATCHASDSWARLRFDHDRDTDFPLRGGHREAACAACHTGTLFEEELGTTCAACHAADDVHADQLGEDCARCHDEQAWIHRVRFDHELTRFPLLGLHAAVPCEACHATPRYHDAETACSACHGDEDPHRRRLGESCAVCHTPNDWKVWRFDHDAQTRFALHGAHEGVDCLTCHREPLRSDAPLPLDCVACHAGEDVHRGGFGRDCARCHGERTWDEVELAR